jgi:YVTN family beta-propeller protein
VTPYLVAGVVGIFSLCIWLISEPQALATRLPAELHQTVLNEFPDGKIRLDGSIETRSGELFLPLVPLAQSAKKKTKVVIEAVFPTQESPDAIFYNNGWCYLRVIKKGVMRTVVSPAAMPANLKKQLLSCRFPSDLIVPEHLVLPTSLKTIIGDTPITTVNDATVASAEFGTPPKKPAAKAGPGYFFLTSLNSGTITMVEEKTLNKVSDFPTEGTPCSMVAAGGKIYISDQAKNRILILDPVAKQFLGQIDLPYRSAPKGIAALPNGKILYVSLSASNDVAVIETETRRVLLRTKVASGPGRLVLTPNANFLLVLNVPCGQINVISTLNQRNMGSIQVGSVPTSVAITKDSQTAYVTNRSSNTVSVIDISKRQVISTIKTGTGPTGIALSADGSKLYVAHARDNTIGIYDTKTREKLQDIRLPLDIDFPGEIALMPDGKHLLISSGATDTIGMLDLEKLEFDKQSRIGHSSHEIIWVPMS